MVELVSQRRTTRGHVPTSRRGDTVATDVLPAVPARPVLRPFPKDREVLAAPELDDCNDRADEQPLELLRPLPPPSRRPPRPLPPQAISPPPPPHRTQRPTSHRRSRTVVSAAHSRAVFAGMAAGAVAAGAYAMSPDARPGIEIAAAQQQFVQDSAGIQIVSVPNIADSSVHVEEIARATAFAQERAQREARLQRPRFMFPTTGIQTSAFGSRWGTLHAGLDIANAVGTPIYAATDGEVIAAGPTAGYGMWVKIRAADGTVTLYGHIDTATVQFGDRVMAGDQIATMGNRGNSTGPHLHFEVHLNGSLKADPMSWLRARGAARD
ncbi:M23 family metallopeptidase [Mycolicibacterium bacteremicum]|nr:M23 family metallopeptidase [Mycolicibacterium bacteremicum]